MQVEEKDGVVVIATNERLDANIASDFRDLIKDMIAKGKNKLVIDLKKTRFIDSSGCGALVASLRSLIKEGGDMKIANPSPQAKTLFELTRLHRVFEIFDSTDDAISSTLGNQPSHVKS
jgi:anti-sigma B factor antagonist